MSDMNPADMVATAMRPISTFDVPAVLRASIERQSQSLLGLASSLVHAGMAETQVRAVIEQACASYRDELITAILALRNCHDA